MIKYKFRNNRGDIRIEEYDLLEDALRKAFNDFYYLNFTPVSISGNCDYLDFKRMKHYWMDFYPEMYVA